MHLDEEYSRPVVLKYAKVSQDIIRLHFAGYVHIF